MRLPLEFLALSIACSAAAQQSANPHAVVDRLLQGYGPDQGPGCAAGVLLKGRVVYEGASGTMDGRQPLAASTPMYLASVSKQFTAAAVYRLVNSGKMHLDQAIGTIIPELPANSAGITIRQLLNHTSGLRDYSALQEVAGQRGPIDNHGVLELLARQRALNFEPGQDYEYSNSDYVILSLAIERVTGIALGEYARREIFAPFGMNRSWFESGGAKAYQPAHGYVSRNGTFQPAPLPPPATGDGGMYGSVSDLLRWLQNLNRPERRESAVVRQLMSPARLKSGDVLPHTSGLFWNRYKGRRTLSHNGSVEGFQADVVHFPKAQLSVVCLCNRGDVDAASVSRQIADAYLGTDAPKASATEASRRPLPSDLSGKWESRQGFILSTRIDAANLIASLAGEEHVMSADRSQKEFATVSNGFKFVLRRRGADTLEVGWEGGRPNAFRRIKTVRRGSPDLNQYAGRFVNAELNLNWNLLVSEGSLLITTPAGWRIPMAATAPDRFEVGPWFLEFKRTAGKVSSLALHRERLWEFTFQRLDETPK